MTAPHPGALEGRGCAVSPPSQPRPGRFAWLVLLALPLLLGAKDCGSTPPPPATCPATCPHGSACTDPAKGCQPIPAPGEVCQPGEYAGCWHFPDDSDSWLWACYAPWLPGGVVSVTDPALCPAAPPPVDPCGPVVCPAGQHCEAGHCMADPSPPDTGCILSGQPTEVVPGYAPQHGQLVNQAILRVHPECGGVGGRCVVPERPQAFQAAVEAELRKAGLCAGQHAPDTDEIAVSTPGSGIWEGYHIYAGAWDDPAGVGAVVWAPNSARPAWKAPGGPTPPPAGACPAPQPDRSPEHLIIALKCEGRWCDATPQTKATLPYCTQIGMSPMADGTLRAGCPMRSECPGWDCEHRKACELWALGGDYRWETQPPGSIVLRNLDNPAQSSCTGCSAIRVCSQDESVCSTWVSP